MRLTSRSEYALIALTFLARKKESGYHSVEAIATAQRIPYKFLEQILLILKRAGFVESMRGSNGGYRLARKPKDVALADIIRLFDGALAPTSSASKFFYRSSPIEREPKLLKVFKHIRDLAAGILEKTTLKDML